ncbi:hypothetical protein [Kiloniella majae]|uniref:hypothetical protein n=1 Tax=Kiloniella majae TaxID=1938558 RepID=UPI000A2789C1|nr:hypothetical protein [Kiloniella majae]
MSFLEIGLILAVPAALGTLIDVWMSNAQKIEFHRKLLIYLTKLNYYKPPELPRLTAINTLKLGRLLLGKNSSSTKKILVIASSSFPLTIIAISLGVMISYETMHSLPYTTTLRSYWGLTFENSNTDPISTLFLLLLINAFFDTLTAILATKTLYKIAKSKLTFLKFNMTLLQLTTQALILSLLLLWFLFTFNLHYSSYIIAFMNEPFKFIIDLDVQLFLSYLNDVFIESPFEANNLSNILYSLTSFVPLTIYLAFLYIMFFLKFILYLGKTLSIQWITVTTDEDPANTSSKFKPFSLIGGIFSFTGLILTTIHKLL